MLKKVRDVFKTIDPTVSSQYTTNLMVVINNMVVEATSLEQTLNAYSSSFALNYLATASTKIASFNKCS